MGGKRGKKAHSSKQSGKATITNLQERAKRRVEREQQAKIYSADKEDVQQFLSETESMRDLLVDLFRDNATPPELAGSGMALLLVEMSFTEGVSKEVFLLRMEKMYELVRATLGKPAVN